MLTPQPSPPETTATTRSRGSWLRGLEGVAYGGDYNPEQWPEETWAQDVALMREARVNLVTIGVFSWALVEPREGEFDFGWLDRLFDLLHTNGIRIDLATPTASPPAWFFRAHPGARVVDRNGVVKGFGSRGMAGPSSPEYRAAIVRVTTALAKRYGSHPALALWHVHNEYGGAVCEDYSQVSAQAFREWLRARYDTLGALNAAWGTSFWGQRYGDWVEVGVPGVTPSVVNPAQRLDFARFSDAALRECFILERDVIRTHSDIPVTTNFMAGTSLTTDLWAWAREVDVVSNDHYLTAADAHPEVGLALSADLTRSLAGGAPWILMEHSPSAVNWQPRNRAKRPGEMRRNALSHLGRGADAILFFQWRASRSGAEKFHSAMVPHAGTTSRVWREVVDLGRDLGRLGELHGSTVKADVAILWDWESFWAQDLEWRPSVDLDHRERVDAFYTRLWQDGLAVDFAHPEADLSGYRIVIAPASYLLTRQAAANLTRYVADGGHLVVSYFSCIVDEHDAVHEGGFLAALRQALGLTVEEFLPLAESAEVQLTWDHEGVRAQLAGRVWSEDIALEGADVVATYADGPAAGRPAATRHEHGAGTAWYISTAIGVADLAIALAPVFRSAGLTPRHLTDGLEVVVRRGMDHDYLIAMNHAEVAMELPTSGLELLSGTAVAGSWTLEPGGVAVVRQPPTNVRQVPGTWSSR